VTQRAGHRRAYVGVDPGKGGALVAACYDPGTALPTLDVLPMPVAGSGKNERVQGWVVYSWLAGVIAQWGSVEAGIERVGARPMQGVVSTFNFGHATGVVYGVMSAVGLSMQEVDPKAWGKSMLAGRPRQSYKQRKASAVLVAGDLFPELREHLLLRAGKNRGRYRAESGVADAALIAAYMSGAHASAKAVG